jgi:uncharacterized protein (DUF433 family)
MGPMSTRTKAKPKSKPRNHQPRLVGEHLAIDPRVCHGELTFRGTRVPAETILRYLADGYSLAYVRKSWPEVSVEAIQEAIRLASEELVLRYRNQKS